MRILPDSAVGGRTLAIRCPCGTLYDAPALRLLRCPACGHVWDLGDPLAKENNQPMPQYMRLMAWRTQMKRVGLQSD